MIIKLYISYAVNSSVAKHNDINPAYLPEIEKALEEKQKTSNDDYIRICKAMLDDAIGLSGNRKLVCGEGVSYIASYDCKQTELRQGFFPAFAYFIYLNH